jgi:hypothetical protein
MTGFDRAENPVTALIYQMSDLTGTIGHKAKRKTIVSGREELSIYYSGLNGRVLSPDGKIWHSELVVHT